MKLPTGDSSAIERYLFGRYTIRALIQAGFGALVAKVDPVNDAVRAASHAVEVARGQVEEEIAARNFVDGGLDLTARTIRSQLAGRELGAERRTPYILVFPKRIEEYVRAPLGEQVSAYQLLCTRLLANLPPDDPLCTSATVGVPAIRAGLAAWSAASAQVDVARGALDTANSRLQLANREWEQTMLEVYGLLLGQVGRQRAELFFSRVRSKRNKPAASGEVPAPPPDACEPEADEDELGAAK
jgi:hypothetical protein